MRVSSRLNSTWSIGLSRRPSPESPVPAKWRPVTLVGQGEGTLLTTVSDVDPMRVYISISERDYLVYQRLKTEGKLTSRGGELSLVLADGSTFPEKGRIIIAVPAGDFNTGTLILVAVFPQSKERCCGPGSSAVFGWRRLRRKTLYWYLKRPSLRCKAPMWFM